jgi:hypothetical protein
MKYKEKFIFDPFYNDDSDLIRRTGKTEDEFYELMRNYNANIIYDSYSISNAYFESEEDIKKAINYLQPFIDGYWVMFKLCRENMV